MKEIRFIFLVLPIFPLVMCSVFKEKKDAHKVIRVEITYMDLLTSYYVSLIPSHFYQADDLFKKVFTSKSICDSMAYYTVKISTNNKAEYQGELDTRVAIKLIYADKSKRNIYLDYGGQLMLDTIGTVYKKDDAFINYLQKTINDPIAKWSK